MGRRIRHLGVAVFFVGVALAYPTAALSVADLETLAQTEAVRELSLAAGWALVEPYAASKTAEQLEALTAATAPGIAAAARGALALLRDPLQELVSIPTDELLVLAAEAETSDERLNAARAYYVRARGELTVDRLSSDAADAASEELQQAAGEVLGGFYVLLGEKTLSELIDQTLHSPVYGLRVAAATATSALIVTSDLSDEELVRAVVEYTMWSRELAEAYGHALAQRYRAELEEEDPR